jgi:monofunctional biosynthetic peptidoglycan transglycosylase
LAQISLFKRRQGQILRLMNLVPKFPPVDKEKAKGQDTKKQKNKKKKK